MKLRIALFFSLILALTLFIVFGYFYFFLQQYFKDEGSVILNERILLINDILKDKKNGLDTLRHRIEHEWNSPNHEPLWLQVKTPDERLFAESPAFSSISDSAQYLSNINIKTNINNPSSLFVSLRLDRTKEKNTLVTYGRNMMLFLLFTIGVSSFFTFKLISKEIFPLLKMSRKMRRISLRSLHRRIETKNFPLELVPVAQSFNTMLNELEKSFQQISRFSSDIAHELRTPLNALMIKIEVMMEKPRSTQEYQELLESLSNDTRGLSKLIDTLLFLARTENPKRTLLFERININEEIRSLIDFYEAIASEKSIQISLQSQDEIFLDVEKSLFDRALGNLLQNSIQYCQNDASVQIEISRDSESIIIAVIDNGPGIDAKHLPFIFNRLYRVDSSRNPNSGGLGLGLSIVASIMKLHGGLASVESTKGEKTSFKLSFPSQQK